MKTVVRNIVTGLAFFGITGLFGYGACICWAGISQTGGWAAVALASGTFAFLSAFLFFCWGIGSAIWADDTAEEKP